MRIEHDGFVTDAGAYSRHAEAQCDLGAEAAKVFEHIDRPERLSAHMGRRSWRLAGSSMQIEPDSAGGRAVGSRIRLKGSFLGVPLEVVGEVIERNPPVRKAWQTVAEPTLLVIGRYRMAVDVRPLPNGSHVRIAIDYDLPARRPYRWLGLLLGHSYAKWCVQQMAADLAGRS